MFVLKENNKMCLELNLDSSGEVFNTYTHPWLGEF